MLCILIDSICLSVLRLYLSLHCVCMCMLPHFKRSMSPDSFELHVCFKDVSEKIEHVMPGLFLILKRKIKAKTSDRSREFKSQPKTESERDEGELIKAG